MIALLSTAYFAPIQYYSKIVSAQKAVIEKYENYQKQTYRNRCVIYSANGPQTITVPVTKGNQVKIHSKDIRIDYSMNWQKIHFKAIESAYRCSPFYQYYIDDFMSFFQKKHLYLYDVNLEILDKTCQILGFGLNISETTDYVSSIPEGYCDFRELIHPKERMFKPDPAFVPPVYTQVFGPKNGFIGNMSILDLIFNTGTEALVYLQKSNTQLIHL
jgi:hypothetical protein